MLILVTGGVRSGKSTFAESLIKSNKTYIATMRFFDNETLKRIELHKQRRNDEWETYEVYTDLKPMSYYLGKDILLDCLTNLVTNEILDNKSHKNIINKIYTAIIKIQGVANKLIIVTNNVFEEIDNYSELTETFLEVLGKLSTKIALQADIIYECEYGICQTIGGKYEKMD